MTLVALASVFIFPARGESSGDNPEDLVQAGHYKRARPMLEVELAKNPSDARALSLLSRVKQEFGDLDGARALAEKAIALDSSKADYHFQLGGVCGEKLQRASKFKALGLAHCLRDEMLRAIQLDSKHVRARAALVDFYSFAPGIAGGDKKKAHAMADELLQIQAARGYLALGSLAMREDQKDLSKAESLFRKAVEADPNDYRARVGLSRFYSSDRVKKYEQATSEARAAVKLDPSRVSAYAQLAFLYGTLQRRPELDALLTEAEKAVPDDFAPYYQAGRALFEAGTDLERAERYLRKYLTQEPEGAEPRLETAHWRLGQILEKQGRKPEAISELETSLRLDPDFEPAKKDLRRLK